MSRHVIVGSFIFLIIALCYYLLCFVQCATTMGERPRNLRTLVLNEGMWLNVKMTGYRTRTASQPRHRHKDVPLTTHLPGVPPTTSQKSSKELFWHIESLMSPPVSRSLAAGFKLHRGHWDVSCLWFRSWQWIAVIGQSSTSPLSVIFALGQLSGWRWANSETSGLASQAFAVLQHMQVRKLCLKVVCRFQEMLWISIVLRKLFYRC